MRLIISHREILEEISFTPNRDCFGFFFLSIVSSALCLMEIKSMLHIPEDIFEEKANQLVGGHEKSFLRPHDFESLDMTAGLSMISRLEKHFCASSRVLTTAGLSH